MERMRVVKDLEELGSGCMEWNCEETSADWTDPYVLPSWRLTGITWRLTVSAPEAMDRVSLPSSPMWQAVNNEQLEQNTYLSEYILEPLQTIQCILEKAENRSEVEATKAHRELDLRKTSTTQTQPNRRVASRAISCDSWRPLAC